MDKSKLPPPPDGYVVIPAKAGDVLPAGHCYCSQFGGWYHSQKDATGLNHKLLAYARKIKDVLAPLPEGYRLVEVEYGDPMLPTDMRFHSPEFGWERLCDLANCDSIAPRSICYSGHGFGRKNGVLARKDSVGSAVMDGLTAFINDGYPPADGTAQDILMHSAVPNLENAREFVVIPPKPKQPIFPDL